MKKILVTGGNRGIGLEICKQLAAAGHQVILCARNPEMAKEAIAGLKGNFFVMQLDVTNDRSIRKLAASVENKFGYIDVLINNAGIGSRDTSAKKALLNKFLGLIRSVTGISSTKLKGIAPSLEKFVPFAKDVSNIDMKSANRTMQTNFYGPWKMIQAFIPLLLKSEDPRIINMSSGMGQLESLSGNAPGYRISKAALNALTIMFANYLQEQGIRVNAMCPGWVRTDMGGPDAPRDVSQGADTAVWLATADNIPTGKFFRDRQEIPF